MTGSNLPPGCEVHHIPGNRKEDEAIEVFWETLESKFRDEHPEHDKIITELLESSHKANEAIIALVEMARDMGHDAGYADGEGDAAIAHAQKEYEAYEKSKSAPDQVS